jgi:transcriptional regulator with XRE-family HTH domain
MRLRFPPNQDQSRRGKKSTHEVVIDLPTESRESSDVDAGYQMQQLGRVIREARRKKHLSLEALAARAEVSSGLLSQIERGFGNPSFVTLTKIATALDVPMTAFYQGPLIEGRMLVTKADRQRLSLPHGVTYELLSPDFGGPFSLMRASVAGKFETKDDPITHEGTETMHVLSGNLEITIADQTYPLEAGDSITFDSGQPHWIRNPLNRSAELFITVSASGRPGTDQVRRTEAPPANAKAQPQAKRRPRP